MHEIYFIQIISWHKHNVANEMGFPFIGPYIISGTHYHAVFRTSSVRHKSQNGGHY